MEYTPGKELTKATGSKRLVAETRDTAMEVNMEGSGSRKPNQVSGVLDVYHGHRQDSGVGGAAPEEEYEWTWSWFLERG